MLSVNAGCRCTACFCRPNNLPFQAHPPHHAGSPPHQRDLAVDLRGVLALRVGVLHGGQLKQAHAKAAGRSRRGGTTSASGMSAQARRWVIRAQHSRLRQCQAETAAEMGCDCTPNRSPAQIGGGAPYHAQACRQPPNSLHSPRTHRPAAPQLKHSLTCFQIVCKHTCTHPPCHRTPPRTARAP